ncbi:MAG: type II toxin-antitoxin system mRNA interferase toxin, RelE/StbE family [Patescibacteria group bacterium]
MEIVYSSKFAREYKKLSKHLKDLAERQEAIFRIDPFDRRLRSHKLHGKFNEFLSFSVDYRYRIVFEFSRDKKIAYFYSVGDHDVYQ